MTILPCKELVWSQSPVWEWAKSGGGNFRAGIGKIAVDKNGDTYEKK